MEIGHDRKKKLRPETSNQNGIEEGKAIKKKEERRKRKKGQGEKARTGQESAMWGCWSLPPVGEKGILHLPRIPSQRLVKHT